MKLRLTYNVKSGYSQNVIRSFSCQRTERLFNREVVKEFANIASVASRRLFALNNARREGQHSIRINDQYRVCFTWKEDGPHEVEITKHYRQED